MTISSETRVTTPAVGNGVTTVFAFTFKVFETSDLVVKETTDAGVESTLVETTDYVVTLNADQDTNPGGSITLTDPLTTDYLLTMTSAVPNLQATKITNLGGFYPAILNAVFDRLTILVQQALVPVTRSVKIPISDGTMTTELPTKTLRANKALVFDADGNIDISVGDYADPAVYANAAAASAAAALVSENNAETAETNAEAAQAAAEAAQSAAEAAASGMKWRPPVKAATTTTLPACTYANGTGGVGATLTGNANGALAAQDGVTLVAADRLLVKDQASTLQNGVYVVTQVGTAGTPFILTRAADADTWDELVAQTVAVEQGSTLADYTYICTVDAGGTIGTTAITWSTFKIVLADGSVTYAKTSAGVQASLDLADTALQSGDAFSAPLLHIQDQKSSGTAGGGFTSGAWQTRTLNTEVTDEIGSTLSSNQFTLPAGTYEIEASAPAYSVTLHQVRLYNITDAAVTLTGTNEVSSNGGYATSRSFVSGRFTIASTKTLELQHRCSVTKATDGFGLATSWGTEIYADVKIRKVA